MNSTETPGGSGIPAGWYDDPSGHGLRWWDGDQWTEHVHSAESAAAAGGAAGTGGREGAPPRDLVRLRESIRARGTKAVGIVLGAVVVVAVVIALLVSGGSNGSGGNPEPVPAGPTTGTPAKHATAKREKQLRKRLKSGKLDPKQKKALRAELKALEAAGGKGAKKSAE